MVLCAVRLLKKTLNSNGIVFCVRPIFCSGPASYRLWWPGHCQMWEGVIRCLWRQATFKTQHVWFLGDKGSKSIDGKNYTPDGHCIIVETESSFCSVLHYVSLAVPFYICNKPFLTRRLWVICIVWSVTWVIGKLYTRELCIMSVWNR